MKFDPAEVNENTIEQDFFICNDLEGCEALLKKAGQAEAVGIALLWDKEVSMGWSGIKGRWKCIMFLWRNGNSSLFK